MPNKKRKCVNCKEYGEVDKGIVKSSFYCSVDCMAEYGCKNRFKGAEKLRKQKKRKVVESDIEKQHVLTQKSFNRMRVLQEKIWFAERGLEPECISCGKTKMDWCCGHFKTRGSQGNLRYDEKNTYLQCNRYCNFALSGNINGNKTTRGYIRGLHDRYGDDGARKIIEYCETNTQVKKWTCEELIEMRKKFNKKIREHEKQLEE